MTLTFAIGLRIYRISPFVFVPVWLSESDNHNTYVYIIMHARYIISIIYKTIIQLPICFVYELFVSSFVSDTGHLLRIELQRGNTMPGGVLP